MGEKLKVVAIDDNALSKNQIRDMMPDYVDLVTTSFGEAAKEAIRPERDGRTTNLIIMNADDSKGHSLYLFDWLKNGESELELDRIPVILLTKDEFSDRIMSFLEIGDAELYEGEPDEEDFYIFMMDVLDKAEKEPEPREFPVYYSGEKDMDRIAGLSVKPLGEDDDTIKRTIVLAHEDQRDHLERALERGRKKQELIRDLLDTAIILKTERKEEKKRKEQERAEVAVEEEPEIIEEKIPTSPYLHKLNPDDVQKMLEEEEEEKTIVVVDNDSMNLSLINMYLKRRYNVVTLNSGMSAIDYFVRSKADLLLLNYSMPILDGPKILDSIRWQPNGKKVPAIFMTDISPSFIQERCRKEYVLGILPKPIAQEALNQAITAAFKMRF